MNIMIYIPPQFHLPSKENAAFIPESAANYYASVLGTSFPVYEDEILGNFQNALFISDYSKATKKEIEIFQEIGKKTSASYHFIFAGLDSFFSEPSYEAICEKVFQNCIPDISFRMSVFKREESEQGIQAYIEEHKIDLLVLNYSDYKPEFQEDNSLSEFIEFEVFNCSLLLLKI